MIVIFIRIYKNYVFKENACFFSVAKSLRLVDNNTSNLYLLDFEKKVETEIQPHSKHRSVSSSECLRIVSKALYQ